MPNQPTPVEPRILLTGVQELDEFARQFRRKLRDVAIEFWREAGHPEPIDPDLVRRAVPRACRELLAEIGSGSGDERDADGDKKEAA